MGTNSREAHSGPDTESPATLSDVAKAAGVSLATASRAVNGSERRVGEQIRERVIAAARKLDYTPNAGAQATVRGWTGLVGLVVADIADPYFSSIAAGVMTSAEEHQLLVSVASTLRRPERELDYLASNRGQRSRAVILASSRIDNPDLTARLMMELDAYRRAGGRVVVISQGTLPVDSVVVGNRSGARELAQQLIALGYRRFGVLAGPRDVLTAQDRSSGFRGALAEAGLSPVSTVPGEFTRDGGYNAMQRLLADQPGMDCVFAVNDVMAVGAMAAARDGGLRLPEDLGVAGFDDIATLRDIRPALTTVRLPLEQLGKLAMTIALQPRAARPRRRKVGGEVVVRESTPPRG